MVQMAYLMVVLAVLGGAMATTNHTEAQAIVRVPLTAKTDQLNNVYAALEGMMYKASIPTVWDPTTETVFVVMIVTDSLKEEETASILVGDSDIPSRFGSRVVDLDVVSAGGEKVPADFLKTPIEVTFPRPQLHPKEKMVCAFKPADSMQWSTNGCRMASITDDDVICNCGYLGKYALLLQPIQVTSAPYTSLIVAPLGLVLSVASVALCAVLLGSRQRRNGRIVAPASLSFAQVALYLTIFLQDDENHVKCTTAAILLHFFWLAGCNWIAIAGALCYLTSHNELTPSSRIRPVPLLLLGWGCAAVGVATSVVVGVSGNPTRTDSCWLPKSDVFVWELVGPFVLFIKALITCHLTWQIGGQQKTLSRQDTIKIRFALRMVVVLELCVCLLWMLGFGDSAGGSRFLASAFVVLNSLQAFFVFYTGCLLKDELVVTDAKTTKDPITESTKN